MQGAAVQSSATAAELAFSVGAGSTKVSIDCIILFLVFLDQRFDLLQPTSSIGVFSFIDLIDQLFLPYIQMGE